jgi:putative FmdB family regulatory protein
LPTYEYACTACGHRLDAVQKFTDDALTVCPECGGSLRKVYAAPGIVLKGSGFYKTDSRSGNGRSDSGSEAKKESKETAPSSSDSKSDSGPKTEKTASSSDGASTKKESKPAATTAS